MSAFARLRLTWLVRLLWPLRRYRWFERFAWWLWGHSKTRCPYCVRCSYEDWLAQCDCFLPLLLGEGRET